ncbi:argininosuccinate lyase [Xylariaceae sp. AK1471]|nr:argininosuccinate lyase [Xylariaceae sp. AK1471]
MASDKKPETNMWSGPSHSIYNENIYIDKAAYRQDILGSITFARANNKGGILTADQFQKIESGLQAVMKECAGKVTRDELRMLEARLTIFLQVMAERAEREVDHVMLGHTRSPCGGRLREVEKCVNRSPLGYGALASNPFGIDRDMMAKELGFDGNLLWNSLGAVGDRDFVAETMQLGSMLMMHISRWVEDLIIYSTAEFGFEVRFDSVKTVSDSVQIATGVLATMEIRPDRMHAALDHFMLATDIADYLVRKGVPFCETHHISGRVVPLSEQTNTPMNELTFEQLKSIDARFERDITDCVLEQIKVLREMLND